MEMLLSDQAKNTFKATTTLVATPIISTAAAAANTAADPDEAAVAAAVAAAAAAAAAVPSPSSDVGLNSATLADALAAAAAVVTPPPFSPPPPPFPPPPPPPSNSSSSSSSSTPSSFTNVTATTTTSSSSSTTIATAAAAAAADTTAAAAATTATTTTNTTTLSNERRGTTLATQEGKAYYKQSGARWNGRACAACRASKLRCSRTFPCDRCQRLGRVCVLPPRRVRKRHVSAVHDWDHHDPNSTIINTSNGDNSGSSHHRNSRKRLSLQDKRLGPQSYVTSHVHDTSMFVANAIHAFLKDDSEMKGSNDGSSSGGNAARIATAAVTPIVARVVSGSGSGSSGSGSGGGADGNDGQQSPDGDGGDGGDGGAGGGGATTAVSATASTSTCILTPATTTTSAAAAAGSSTTTTTTLTSTTPPITSTSTTSTAAAASDPSYAPMALGPNEVLGLSRQLLATALRRRSFAFLRRAIQASTDADLPLAALLGDHDADAVAQLGFVGDLALPRRDPSHHLPAVTALRVNELPGDLQGRIVTHPESIWYVRRVQQGLLGYYASPGFCKHVAPLVDVLSSATAVAASTINSSADQHDVDLFGEVAIFRLFTQVNDNSSVRALSHAAAMPFLRGQNSNLIVPIRYRNACVVETAIDMRSHFCEPPEYCLTEVNFSPQISDNTGDNLELESLFSDNSAGSGDTNNIGATSSSSSGSRFDDGSGSPSISSSSCGDEGTGSGGDNATS